MPRLILQPTRDDHIQISGLIFDMDGTLVEPQTWMFKEMRDAVKLYDTNIDILHHVSQLTPEERLAAEIAIANVEDKAMLEMKPQLGLEKLIEYLDRKEIPKAICTRNQITPVAHLLEHIIQTKFDPIITREFKPTKPSGAPLLHIASQWGVDPKSVLMIGDSLDDMRAGFNAGCITVLIKTHANEKVRSRPEVNHIVDSLDEIISLIESGMDI